ncbi:MAG TPA: amino acid permease [Steroidobacteraceae bacterium]|nr:amino acid permease [Steroidobacteraceae bacterium]
MTEQATGVPTRALGFWMCTALVVGNIIGIGVFLMPAALAPYGINALTGWLVTVIGCVFLAYALAGLARAFPQDDGPYGYSQRAFGDGTAFMIMWSYWVATWITNATLAIGVVGYMSFLVPALAGHPLYPPLIALSLLWMFVLLNLRGVRTVGWMQVVTTVLKLLPLLAVVLLGLWQLVSEPASYTTHVPATPLSLRDAMAASTIALFAMLGLECATIPAARVRDPERTIPRATLAGTIITSLIYIGVCAIPMFLIPQGELAASNAPLADLLSRFIGAGSGELIAVFVIVSGLGALNGWTLVVGEVTQSLAKRGNFPRIFARENRYGAPTLAFVLCGVVASVMLLMNYNQSLVSIFTFLSVVVTAANLPLYLVCSLAVLVLWRRGQIRRVGRRGWGLFVAAALAAAYCVWAFLGVGWKSLAWALVLCGAGVPVYVWSWYRQRRTQAVASGAA